MKNKKVKSPFPKIRLHRTLRFWFIGVMCMLLTIACLATAVFFIVMSRITFFNNMLINFFVETISMAISCIIIGTAISLITSGRIMRKIKNISDGMAEISKGNFEVRVNENDKANMPSEFGELERSFNKMASDLEGIEMFRNDFINNFSHEFKTPIVSIRGFARQLQNPNLTDEEKEEYISIIISESERLTKMSSNILLLTKLENQQIVTEKTSFSLDEQIRRCILLLEKDWDKKNIDFNLDNLNETQYTFNEEMMSHVWINLLSNAIKFSPDGGSIKVELDAIDGKIICAVTDEGEGMSEETCSRIFEKFYQGDKSHSGSGNGIGLNIVSRIVTLAGGEVKVSSTKDVGSRFEVHLPNVM